MPGLRGYWPDSHHPTYDRRLTARPAVLAKTYGSGLSLPVLTVDSPGLTLLDGLRVFPGTNQTRQYLPL